MVVVVEEAQGRLLLLVGEVRLQHAQGQLPEQQGGARLIPVVALVAHLEDLGDHGLDVDLPDPLHGCPQHRIQAGSQPVQPVDDLLVAGAEAQHLAQALVKGTIGFVAKGLVLHPPYRHGIGHHARHGAYRVMMVAGVEGDLPGGRQLFRFFQVLGQSLVDQAAHDGAPHRAAHPVPGNGRARMEDGLLGHAGQQLPCGAQADQGRLGVEDPGEGLGVGRGDLFTQLPAVELAEHGRQPGIASRGGLPVDMYRLFVLG